jgi:Phage tail assembly chaperone
MAKLKLVAAPTFRAKVGIPVAGGEAVPIEFIFKHRTRDALDEFIRTRAEQRDDLESFLEIVEGWELEDEFTRENAGLLLQNYIGAALAVYRAYVEELVQAKLKN